eukprot:c45808_g1_i1.p1 GENE.c45808_g1_i1~~c45808_g1_i1.p1  ORF type:complete len:302 (+),score=82.15 c45808_g1_i1:49-954(+)
MLSPDAQQVFDAAERLSDGDLDGLFRQLETLHRKRITEAKASFLRAVFAVEGNDECADCSSNENLTWASSNLGVVLCLECVGGHRNLGTHISKPLSLKMDAWSEEQQQQFLAHGNRVVNAQLEAQDVKQHKPNAKSPVEHKHAYVRAKYETKSFASGGNGTLPKWTQSTGTAKAVKSQVHCGIVFLKIEKATDLIAGDMSGTSDPFVKARCGKHENQTPFVPTTLNPVWNHTLQLNVDSIDDPVRLLVIDHDMIGSGDPLGEAIVSLSHVQPNSETSLELPLAGVDHGTLFVKVTWVPLDA